MQRKISFNVNGKDVTIEIDVRESLLEVLRGKLHLNGVKKGCEVGECGACTVIIDDETVDSCIYLAAWAEGKRIRTIEGEQKDGKLSPMQQAFIEEGAVQCGFCSPGFILSASNLVEKRGKNLSREEIRKHLAGNMCRCTGYQTIINAVEKVIRER